MKDIPSCVSVVSSSVCKYGAGEGTDLADGKYCKMENNRTLKLYKSGSDNCSEITTPIIIKYNEDDGVYEDASVGTDSGQIFSCSSNGCVQYKSNYHLFSTTNLYECASDGTCSNKQIIVAGYYLSGPPTVSGSKLHFLI